MLTPYRRHLRTCQSRSLGRRFIRCTCPIWCDGNLNGSRVRRSVGTRDWNEAQYRIRDWENLGLPKAREVPHEPTVCELHAAYVADMTARELASTSIRRYVQLLNQMEVFATANKVELLHQWDLKVLRLFRQSWKDTGVGVVKKLERLRTVMRFALESGWLKENFALKLKAPKPKDTPTLPFTPTAIRAVLEACDRYQGKRRQLRALVLLMRYSGLRIGDAVTISRDRIRDGKLFLYTQKTGTPVWCPLPEVVTEALAAFDPATERYYFWGGQGDAGAFSRLWMKKLNTVFGRAKTKLEEADCRDDAGNLQGAHSHRFRDTFAVELLLAGVPLERVSILLGHSSLKVTEKHYSPWVKARQEQLEADVRRSWAGDALTAASRAKVVAIGA